MTADEALAFIETVLEQRSLTKVERAVFLGVWDGLSYAEIAKQSDYDPGYIKLVSHKLWHLLTQSLGERISKNTLQSVVRKHLHGKHPSVPTQTLTSDVLSRQDWGEVVDVSVFYGRTDELNTLEQWVETDRCRLVAILGMGGQGKTAISVKLAQQIQDKFDFVVWRSLTNAKSPEEKLIDIIKFLSGQRETEYSNDLEDLISKLLEYLQQHRCLIVLDNFESVLQSGDRAGSYRSGYEGYGVLLKRIGEVSHRSCLTITSREMPEEVAMLEGDIMPVRFLLLQGIDESAAEHILNAKGLFSQPNEVQKLVNWYRGNPLALKIAATSIKEIFSGSLARFLEQKNTIFSGITNLIDQQFRRLTPLEKQVMFWLAINRESAQADDLKSDIVPSVEQSDLYAALGSLKRRSMIEDSLSGFTQQPVVMEYITGLLIEQVYQEIAQEQPLGILPSIQAKLHKQLFYLRHYALIQATAKDYVRLSQIRFILEPLIVKLKSSLGTKQGIVDILFQTLQELRKRDVRSPEGRSSTPGYGGGNIINLLTHLNVDLTGRDFSHLTIRQAYLPEVKLHRVNFSHTEILKSVFTEVLGGVLSVSFSPNGKLLAIGDTRGEIHLWRVRDSKPLQTYKGHTSWVRSIAFNPSGTMLASSSNDQAIELWDVETGECLQTFHGEIGPIMSVCFSPDGQVLASGHADRTVRLWDVESGHCLETLLGHEDIVSFVAYSPNGDILASSSDDQTVRLWDVETGECIRILEGHTDIVWSIAFSPDGNSLASSSEDHSIKLWNIETGTCFKTLTGHNHIVFSVSFSHDGSTLASGSADRTIRLWNLATAKCFKILVGHNHWVRAVAFEPNSLVLASSSGDEMVKLWEISTGQCIKTFQGHIGRSWSANKGVGQDITVSSHDHLQNLWEVNSGQQFRILQGYTNAIWSIAFHPTACQNGTMEGILASGSDDSIVRLWNLQTGECVKSLSGHGGRVWSIAFSPDGNILASCSEDCTIKLWHVKSGHCITTINEHPDEVRSLAFSHDGQFIATGDMGHAVKLWRVLTGERLQIFEGHSRAVLSVAFSHDDQTLVSSSRDKTVKLWRINTGECLQTLNGHTEAISAVALNAESTLIATGSSSSKVRLWEVETGECLQVIHGHEGNVLSVAFSPYSCDLNQVLISGGEDCTIKTWDLNSGKTMLTMQGHTGTVHSVVVSPDGNAIASGSRDETIKLWDMNTGKCLRTLREPRPYEELNIKGAIGLSSAQKAKLIALGAVEVEQVIAMCDDD